MQLGSSTKPSIWLAVVDSRRRRHHSGEVELFAQRDRGTTAPPRNRFPERRERTLLKAANLKCFRDL